MTSDNQWPREIWMAEREEYDQGILSVSTAQDETHDHRYVDGDIYDSAEKYWRVRGEAAEAENERLREALAFYADGEWPEDYPGGVLYDPNGHYEKTYIDYGDKARAALGKEET